MLKRILTDPAFLFLVAINAYCIWYYDRHPGEFSTIVFLYWGQSVLIGLFNFFDLLTIRNPSEEVITSTGKTSFAPNGCTALFFAVHYGIFHIVYGIFILIDSKLDIDFYFVLIGLAAFSLNLIIQFIREKQYQQTHSVSISGKFFLPYLRVVPMHLMILGPAFLHWKASSIFLVLKTIADVLMYLVTSPVHPGIGIKNKTL